MSQDTKGGVLYVSPHLDDVALSCPGFVWRDVQRGERVIVATVMSRGSRAAYAGRRREDRRALCRLGAQALHLGRIDAPFRQAFYDSFTSIVLQRHPLDDEEAAGVASALAELCRQHQPALLVLPLAAGTHIDHRLVHAAWRRLQRYVDEVCFYEDRPYAFVAHQVWQRLHAIGAKIRDPTPPDLESMRPAARRRALLADLRRVGYVRTYLPPGRERCRAARQLAQRLGVKRAEGPELWPETLTDRELGRGAFDLVTEVVGAYTSQIPELFGDLEGFQREARDYSRRIAPGSAYAERLWHLGRV
ncbi:MAG: PIG-L family deacetylase [Acidobacteriota bacterium]